jgi:hypothetical protein
MSLLLHLQRFFKLALEEVQELLDARSNKPTATQHYPVDFTRPETYEHLLRDGNSEEPETDAAAAMQYPSEATAADAQEAGSGAALLEWLQRAAATPAAACEVCCAQDGLRLHVALVLCSMMPRVRQTTLSIRQTNRLFFELSTYVALFCLIMYWTSP